MSFEDSGPDPVALATMHNAVVPHGDAAGRRMLIQGPVPVSADAMQAQAQGATTLIGRRPMRTRREEAKRFGAPPLPVDSTITGLVDSGA